MLKISRTPLLDDDASASVFRTDNRREIPPIQRSRQTGRSLALKPILFSTHVHGSWRFESFHRAVARRRDENTGKSEVENGEDPPGSPVRHNGSSIKIGTALLCNPGVKARVVWWVDSEFLLWEILIVARQPRRAQSSPALSWRASFARNSLPFFFALTCPLPLNEYECAYHSARIRMRPGKWSMRALKLLLFKNDDWHRRNFHEFYIDRCVRGLRYISLNRSYLERNYCGSRRKCTINKGLAYCSREICRDVLRFRMYVRVNSPSKLLSSQFVYLCIHTVSYCRKIVPSLRGNWKIIFYNNYWQGGREENRDCFGEMRKFMEAKREWDVHRLR